MPQGNVANFKGAKGGRPKGSLNEANLMAREMRKQITERVQKELPALMEAWTDAAKGHFMQITTPDGQVKVYKKAPSVEGLKSLMERAMGKPEQPVTGDVSGEVIYRIVRGEIEKEAEETIEPTKQ